MSIGFALNEVLAIATLATGALSLLWWRLRRSGRHHRLRWVGWGAELFTVVALIFTCRVALADWQRVPSASMEPTLRVGDMLLINHLAYGPRLPFTNTALPLGAPRRGDVAVFRFPKDVSQFYVKRIVALAGDRVQFRDGVVAVNGAALRADDLGWGAHPADLGQRLLSEGGDGRTHSIKLNPFAQGRLPLAIGAPHCTELRAGAWDCTVPAGHLMALGDNRDRSEDSRAWGFLPESEVYGRVDRVIFNHRESRRFWHRVS